MISDATQAKINVALQQQDFGAACALSELALAEGEESLLLYRLAALGRHEAGVLRGAVDALANAVRLSPNDPELLTAAADAMREIGRLDEAVALFDEAIARDPHQPASWYGRALALEAAGATRLAHDSFAQVTQLAPATAPGFAGMASTSLQLGNLADARRFAQQAYALAPQDATACLAMAKCALADDDGDAAIRLLNQVSQPGLETLTLLGDALGKVGRHDDAFRVYQAGNEQFVQIYAQALSNGSARERVEAIAQAMPQLSPQSWPLSQTTPEGEAAGHIFLIGFPRSGTTLVEQILASLPDVVTLEEQATLASAECYLSADGIALLDTLTEAQVQALRADYWDRVRSAGVFPEGKTFIDMDPSKSAGLPVIARLFPTAKIVVMHRDPRDVVWSCFRHAFIANAVTLELTSLERTARHFDATMRLIRTCLMTLPVNAHILSYERLVRAFDATTQELCAFLGLTWSEAMRDFPSTAQTRGVRTASTTQVRSALFDGSGQWKPYAGQFASIEALLAPWIENAALTSARQQS
jgi:tetratricopeptide (TPR) repeat protein